jgi:hypothetical protein
MLTAKSPGPGIEEKLTAKIAKNPRAAPADALSLLPGTARAQAK